MSPPRPTAPLHFLVVEDESLLAMDIAMMIEDAGHIVVGEAKCLKEVEALEADLSPHVAFVDVQLANGSSGLDACAHIRKCWSDAIVVFVTANPKKVSGDHGAHGVISKPFSRNTMMSAMRYIAEGICDPPPSSPAPLDLTAFPALSASWNL